MSQKTLFTQNQWRVACERCEYSRWDENGEYCSSQDGCTQEIGVDN